MPLTKVQSQLLGTGAVLQVVQGNLGTISSTTSGSTVYSGATVSITPLFASSKIVALFCPGIRVDVDNDTQGANNGFCRFEYSTDSGSTYAQTSINGNTVFQVPARGANGGYFSFNYIYTLGVTTPVLFRVGIGKSEGARPIMLRDEFGSNNVVLMEIAG